MACKAGQGVPVGVVLAQALTSSDSSQTNVFSTALSYAVASSGCSAIASALAGVFLPQTSKFLSISTRTDSQIWLACTGICFPVIAHAKLWPCLDHTCLKRWIYNWKTASWKLKTMIINIIQLSLMDSLLMSTIGWQNTHHPIINIVSFNLDLQWKPALLFVCAAATATAFGGISQLAAAVSSAVTVCLYPTCDAKITPTDCCAAHNVQAIATSQCGCSGWVQI